jgi:hypothetical protein
MLINPNSQKNCLFFLHVFKNKALKRLRVTLNIVNLYTMTATENNKVISSRKFAMFRLELQEDGMIHLHGSGENPISLEDFKGMVRTIGEMTEGKKVPILCTADELLIVDEETRKYMGEPESNPYSLASAFVVKSISQRLLSNFFIKVSKPGRAVKMFSTKDEAISWLKTYL